MDFFPTNRLPSASPESTAGSAVASGSSTSLVVKADSQSRAPATRVKCQELTPFMNHTLRILSLAFICLVAPTFAADPKAKPKGEVIEFGTFELAGPQLTVPNAKTLDGAERNAPAARFTRQTDKIPAQVGIQFGFRFKLTNLQEASSVDLKTIVKHPPIKNEKGVVEREYTLTTTLTVTDGYVSEVTGYSLDRPEELVPGVWVFEHWYRGQKLVSQSFTVVAPDKPPTKAPTK